VRAAILLGLRGARSGRPSYASAGDGRPARRSGRRVLRALIRKMSRANSLWGAPRIHGEFDSVRSRARTTFRWRASSYPAVCARTSTDDRVAESRQVPLLLELAVNEEEAVEIHAL
jgi:hypothetical protein